MKRLLLAALILLPLSLQACRCDHAPDVGEVQEQED